MSVPYWFLTWWETPPGCMGRLAWPGLRGVLTHWGLKTMGNIFRIFLNQIFHILIEMLLEFVVKVTIEVKACCWTGDNVSPGPVVTMIHMILYDDTRPQWANPAYAELFCGNKSMYLYFIWLFLTELTLVCEKHGSTLLTYIAKTLLN